LEAQPTNVRSHGEPGASLKQPSELRTGQTRGLSETGERPFPAMAFDQARECGVNSRINRALSLRTGKKTRKFAERPCCTFVIVKAALHKFACSQFNRASQSNDCAPVGSRSKTARRFRVGIKKKCGWYRARRTVDGVPYAALYQYRRCPDRGLARIDSDLLVPRDANLKRIVRMQLVVVDQPAVERPTQVDARCATRSR